MKKATHRGHLTSHVSKEPKLSVMYATDEELFAASSQTCKNVRCPISCCSASLPNVQQKHFNAKCSQLLFEYGGVTRARMNPQTSQRWFVTLERDERVQVVEPLFISSHIASYLSLPLTGYHDAESVTFRRCS